MFRRKSGPCWTRRGEFKKAQDYSRCQHPSTKFLEQGESQSPLQLQE